MTDLAGHNTIKTPTATRELPQRVMLVVFIALLAAILTAQHAREVVRHWDFETFYLVAQIVRSGQGSRLYDLSVQAAYQMRYIDPSRVVSSPDLPFFYPAGAALLFLPVAWLPVTLAFFFWTAFNLMLLVLSIRILQRHLPIPAGDRPLFAAVLFIPVYACLLQGQLSIVILFLYAVAFHYFERGNSLAAGVALGLGTLKFQLMLGFFAILLLRRCWKVLAGAALGALPVALASAYVLGWRGALRYPLTVMQFAVVPAAPDKMITLYGAVMTALGRQPPTWLLLILSVGIVSLAGFLRGRTEVVFSAGIVASLLVAYHAYIYELTLILIPAAVIASRIERPSRLLSSFAAAIVAITSALFLAGIQGAAALTFAIVIGGLWYARSHAPATGLDAGARDSLQAVSS